MPIKTQLPVSLCYADTTIQLLPSRSLKMGHTALVLMPLAYYASQYILKLLPCCPCVRIVFLFRAENHTLYLWTTFCVYTCLSMDSGSFLSFVNVAMYAHITSLWIQFRPVFILRCRITGSLGNFFSSAFSAFFSFLKSLSKDLLLLSMVTVFHYLQ